MNPKINQADMDISDMQLKRSSRRSIKKMAKDHTTTYHHNNILENHVEHFHLLNLNKHTNYKCDYYWLLQYDYYITYSILCRTYLNYYGYLH